MVRNAVRALRLPVIAIELAGCNQLLHNRLPAPDECGDHVVGATEKCDDGNLENGDGCNPTCNLTNTTSLLVRPDGTIVVNPTALAVDDPYLYFTDSGNQTIGRVEIATKKVEIIAGVSGAAKMQDAAKGSDAQFENPVDIATDGKSLWVADRSLTATIRRIDLTGGTFAVTTLALRDSLQTPVKFEYPSHVTYDRGYLYVADNFAITRIDLGSCAGDPAMACDAKKVDAQGVTNLVSIFADGKDRLWVADRFHVDDPLSSVLRVVDLNTNAVTLEAGDGTACDVDGPGKTGAELHANGAMTFDGESVYFVEQNTKRIRQLVVSTDVVSTVAGAPLTDPCAGYADSVPTDGQGKGAAFGAPVGIAWHAQSQSLFVTDSGLIRRIQ